MDVEIRIPSVALEECFCETVKMKARHSKKEEVTRKAKGRRFEGRNELERDTELREEFLRIKEA